MTRFALLGLGAAARSIHLPALRAVPGVIVAGGADPDPAAREAFARAAPGVPILADAAKLLDTERPEWALVGAPPAFHRDLTLLALERGSHVLCEKPFVECRADADRILAAAAAASRTVAVNHQYGAMPIFRAAAGAIGSEAFGRLLLLQAWQHVDDRPHQAGSGGGGSGGGANWRAGGKTMQEFGSHVVELCLRFFGGRPESVTARMPRPVDAGGADLIDLVTLEFEGGRAASIVLDRVCRGPHRYLEMRLDGEHASLRVSFGGRARLSVFLSPRRRLPGARIEMAAGGMAWLETGEKRRVLAKNPLDALAAATASHVAGVIEAVARGAEPPGSARAARDVVAVVEAAYESARSGRTVGLG